VDADAGEPVGAAGLIKQLSVTAYPIRCVRGVIWLVFFSWRAGQPWIGAGGIDTGNLQVFPRWPLPGLHAW